MRAPACLSALLAVALLLSAASPLHARAKKGFHTGPYLALEVGAMQAEFDKNQVTGQDVGGNFEPSLGFLFGWNVTDELSAELQGLYTTNRLNAGGREHVASGGVFGKWSIVTDALTDFQKIRILPFVKVGMLVRAASLPNTEDPNDDTMSTIGWGPAIGGGIAFLAFKYFYFGVDVQGEFLLFEEKRTTVNGVPNTLLYKGGLHPSVATLAILGVHY